MPDKVFYDTIPEWDEMRAPARFIVMANLALAVLASYAVYGLIKNKFSSFKQQLMLTTIIGFVILFEFSMIPYPSYSQEPIPDIYEEIKNDESKFAVLPAPIGGTGEYGINVDILIILYIKYIMKNQFMVLMNHTDIPLEAYVPHETHIFFQYVSFSRRILGSKNDIIKQDLAIHGLSLFDYFDIKYVDVTKEFGPDGMYLLSTDRQASNIDTRIDKLCQKF